MTVDPVCGMTMDEKTAKFKSSHMGKTYYFCSAGCKENFVENPEKYVDKDPSGQRMGSRYQGVHYGCCCGAGAGIMRYVYLGLWLLILLLILLR